MSLMLIVAIAALTYASRALPILSPLPLSERLQEHMNRVPPLLFISLAAMSLFGDGSQIAPPTTLAAIAVALCTMPFRSLLITLIGGLSGYALASWFL